MHGFARWLQNSWKCGDGKTCCSASYWIGVWECCRLCAASKHLCCFWQQASLWGCWMAEKGKRWKGSQVAPGLRWLFSLMYRVIFETKWNLRLWQHFQGFLLHQKLLHSCLQQTIDWPIDLQGYWVCWFQIAPNYYLGPPSPNYKLHGSIESVNNMQMLSETRN